MASKYQNDSEVSSPREIIESAMIRAANWRRQYLRSVQANSFSSQAHQEFHAAVIEYYYALRPYRHEDTLGSKWQDAQLWRDDNGEWVTGLDKLGRWINRRKQSVADAGNRGSPGKQTTETQQLPPEQLLRLTSILDDVARELGIAVQVSEQQRPKGRVELPDEEDS